MYLSFSRSAGSALASILIFGAAACSSSTTTVANTPPGGDPPVEPGVDPTKPPGYEIGTKDGTASSVTFTEVYSAGAAAKITDVAYYADRDEIWAVGYG